MTTPWTDRLAGHMRTVAPVAMAWWPRRRAVPTQELSIPIVDDRFGPTSLSATLFDPHASDRVVVLVHGLGGCRSAGYVERAATELLRHGFAALALDLRGADRRGGGFYHVALFDDLVAACATPSLRPFRHVFVLGFSMGGHVALHFAASGAEPRLCGVAALCTPLDLHAVQQHIDGRGCGPYRRYVLRGLKQIYAAVAQRHAVPTPNADVQRCRTFREWDERTIAKRYGYPSPEAFYADRSAGRVLGSLQADSVLVLARNDPIVPPALAMPLVDRAPVGRLHARVLQKGGHLQFARGQSLGLGGGNVGAASVVDQLAQHWQRLLG